MKFKENIKTLVRLFAILIMAPLFLACHQDDPNDSPFVDGKQKKSTILVYAVATNSLTGNLMSDKNEMLIAGANIDLNANNILVFETQYKYLEDNTKTSNVNLLKLVKKGDECSWEVVKDYNDGVASLNPERVSEVIDYVVSSYPAENYGLVFWSHSTGSQPYFTTRSETSENVSLPMQYSFGQDLTISNGADYYNINVDELANAIPDNFFDYIWFDSCYMSNIETIYQFREKCKTYVGYATEVLDAGLPYHYVLPYLTGEASDLISAAQAFYNYYADGIATIAVTDMTSIETLAEYCHSIYQIGTNVSSSGLMKYTRYSTGPFYDFGDYTKALGNALGMEIDSDEWNQILDSCVIYKAATSYDFDKKYIDPDRYSGISTHIYQFGTEDSAGEAYYKSLDWYQRVFN